MNLKIFLVVGLVVAFCAGILGISGFVYSANIIAEKSCIETAQRMSVPSHYSIFEGCQIQVDGNWVPLKNYRYNDGQ